jgi:Sorting nexin 8/Mvp1 BAR domain
MADTLDQRSRVAINSNLEALKVCTIDQTILLYFGRQFLQTQRDLYVAVRDLFTRHDRYSPDAADRLRKRIETQSLKLEGIKSAQKDGWEVEADKLLSSIEKDQQAVVVCLARRVFIRHWYAFLSVDLFWAFFVDFYFRKLACGTSFASCFITENMRSCPSQCRPGRRRKEIAVKHLWERGMHWLRVCRPCLTNN